MRIKKLTYFQAMFPHQTSMTLAPYKHHMYILEEDRHAASLETFDIGLPRSNTNLLVTPIYHLKTVHK